MRNTMILLTLLLSCSIGLCDDTVRKRSQHTIKLVTEPGPFVFGRIIQLKVSYLNQGENPWVLHSPTNSLSVRVLYNSAGSNDHPKGYKLGRIKMVPIRKRTDGKPMTVRLAPVPESISIMPGEKYEFEVCFEREWTGHVVPGIWEVWVEDEDVKLASNKVEIPLLFTTDSALSCLQIASDEDQISSRRKFHADWLQKVMPELELAWWNNNMSDEEKKRHQDDVDRKLHEFEVFMSDKANANIIEAAITEINKGAGLL